MNLYLSDNLHPQRFQRFHGAIPHLLPIPIVDDQQIFIVERRLSNADTIDMVTLRMRSIKTIDVELSKGSKVHGTKISLIESKVDGRGYHPLDVSLKCVIRAVELRPIVDTARGHAIAGYGRAGGGTSP